MLRGASAGRRCSLLSRSPARSVRARMDSFAAAPGPSVGWGRAVRLARSVEETAEGLGIDGPAYRSLIGPLVREWPALAEDILGPPLHRPHHPRVLSRFGLHAVRSAVGLARATFRSSAARSLLLGLGAHSMLPLDRPLSAAVGLVLAVTAHAVGWPVPRGGAQCLTDVGGRRLGRRAGAAVRAGGAVQPLRSHPSARRRGNGLGLLPSGAGRPASRRGRSRGPARAVCAGVSDPGARPARHRAGGPGTLQSELRRRRHQRRRPGPLADPPPSDLVVHPVRHAGARPLSLLVVHTAGRRGPRDVRMACRERRARVSRGRSSIPPSQLGDRTCVDGAGTALARRGRGFPHREPRGRGAVAPIRGGA